MVHGSAKSLAFPPALVSMRDKKPDLAECTL